MIAQGLLPTISETTGEVGRDIVRFKDTNVIPDTEYFYAMTAVNANGESADSNVISSSLTPSCGEEFVENPILITYPDEGNGWSFTADVSEQDGFVVKDVRLKGRYMAKMISVPYFSIKTSTMPGLPQRGELTQFSNAASIRSRLLRYRTYHTTNSSGTEMVDRHLIAEYAVDRLTPTSKSCLRIVQEYVFQKRKPGDRCEPSGTLPCSRFLPKVSYKFIARGGEMLESINIPQRLHFNVNGQAANTMGVFRDCEKPVLNCGLPGVQGGDHLVFAKAFNPAINEISASVAKRGLDQGNWDNLHQTFRSRVSHPVQHALMDQIYGGCPECVHIHWRWGSFIGAGLESVLRKSFPRFSGLPDVGIFVSKSSRTDQDVDIGIMKYKPGEEHPSQPFASLISKDELLGTVVTRRQFGLSRQQFIPGEVVFWYSATSRQQEDPQGDPAGIVDTFFRHGGFFNPELNQNSLAPENATITGPAAQDGINSITYGHLYKEGNTTFQAVSLNGLPAMPSEYEAVGSTAYLISTDAIVSGPHIVRFDVPSISNQNVFNNLAILHLEQDPFDPDSMIWVDASIIAPDTPARDFANRIVTSRVDDIGHFVIGRLLQPLAAPTNADVGVTMSAAPGSVTVDGNVTYQLQIKNHGPQTAAKVGLVNTLPSEVEYVSTTTSQGTCKFRGGAVYCKLGSLNVGSSVNITIVATAREGKDPVPVEGQSIVNTVMVGSYSEDAVLTNNSANQSNLIVPNSNSRPTVTMTAPAEGTTFSGQPNYNAGCNSHGQ